MTAALLVSRLLISCSDSRPQRTSYSLHFISASGWVSKMGELGEGEEGDPECLEGKWVAKEEGG